MHEDDGQPTVVTLDEELRGSFKSFPGNDASLSQRLQHRTQLPLSRTIVRHCLLKQVISLPCSSMNYLWAVGTRCETAATSQSFLAGFCQICLRVADILSLSPGRLGISVAILLLLLFCSDLEDPCTE